MRKENMRIFTKTIQERAKIESLIVRPCIKLWETQKVESRSGVAKGDHTQQDTPKLWQEFLLILPKLQNGRGVNFLPLATTQGDRVPQEEHRSTSKTDYLWFHRIWVYDSTYLRGIKNHFRTAGYSGLFYWVHTTSHLFSCNCRCSSSCMILLKLMTLLLGTDILTGVNTKMLHDKEEEIFYTCVLGSLWRRVSLLRPLNLCYCSSHRKVKFFSKVVQYL